MRLSSWLALFATLVSSNSPALAQRGPRIGLEVKGGLALLTGTGTDDLDNGTAFGANLLVAVTPVVGVYGGYTKAHLPFSGSDGHLNLQGFEGGVQFSPKLTLGPGRPTFAVGATYLKPEFSGSPTIGDVEGDHKLAFRAGLGFDLPLSQLLTASLGGSVTFDPLDKIPPIPDCPPNDPSCPGRRLVQVSLGIRVFPPLFSPSPGR